MLGGIIVDNEGNGMDLVIHFVASEFSWLQHCLSDAEMSAARHLLMERRKRSNWMEI